MLQVIIILRQNRPHYITRNFLTRVFSIYFIISFVPFRKVDFIHLLRTDIWVSLQSRGFPLLRFPCRNRPISRAKARLPHCDGVSALLLSCPLMASSLNPLMVEAVEDACSLVQQPE